MVGEVEGEEVGRRKVLVIVEDPQAEKAKGRRVVELRSTSRAIICWWRKMVVPTLPW